MQAVLRYLLLFLAVVSVAVPAHSGKKDVDFSSDSRKAEVLYMEALVKRVEGDNASFYDLIERAYRLDPDNSIIAYYYGYALLMFDNQSVSKVDEGLRLMKSHFLAHPGDFYENYLYALVCNQTGKKDEAIAVWEKLLSMDRGKVQIYPLLADGYASKGDFKKAIAAYDSLERSEGRSSAISVRKIGYMFAINDTASALSEGRSLLKEAPRNFSYNMLMGDVFLQLSNADSAMVYYDKAQKIDPENGYVSLSKANVYSMEGDSLNYEREINSAIVNKNIDVDVKIRILTNYIRKCIEENDSSARVDNMFKVVIGQHPHESDILKLSTVNVDTYSPDVYFSIRIADVKVDGMNDDATGELFNEAKEKNELNIVFAYPKKYAKVEIYDSIDLNITKFFEKKEITVNGEEYMVMMQCAKIINLYDPKWEVPTDYTLNYTLNIG